MLRASLRRRSALVVIASMLGATAFSTFAGDQLPGQPYASYWFPSTILDWDPATDPDAPFNRGTVPLAARFSNPDFNVNPHAHLDEGRVQALVAFAPTSFNPSQGSATEDYYALNYWQYIDQRRRRSIPRKVRRPRITTRSTTGNTSISSCSGAARRAKA